MGVRRGLVSAGPGSAARKFRIEVSRLLLLTAALADLVPAVAARPLFDSYPRPKPLNPETLSPKPQTI